jgi:hypothetical protein
LSSSGELFEDAGNMGCPSFFPPGRETRDGRLRTINAKAETITTTPALRGKTANSSQFPGYCVFSESCWRNFPARLYWLAIDKSNQEKVAGIPMKKYAAIASLLAALGAASSQAASPQSSAAASSSVAFVYVSNFVSGDTNVITAYAAAADGRLTPVPGSPFANNVISMAVNGKYLFGANRASTSSTPTGTMPATYTPSAKIGTVSTSSPSPRPRPPRPPVRPITSSGR